MAGERPGASDLTELVELLHAAGVDSIIVGVNGINFYARDASEAVATQDLDLLLRPTLANLQRALP
jgi:hypothetical protein